MRRATFLTVAGVTAAALAPAAGAAATASSGALTAGTSPLTPVHLTPAAGGPATTFRLSFRRPAATGTEGSPTIRDGLNVVGPQRRGCVGSAEMLIPGGARDTVAQMVLAPRRLGGRWCTGTFHGTITQTEGSNCVPTGMAVCPDFVIAPRTIARFTFRVRRSG